jgi:hypothetical protein
MTGRSCSPFSLHSCLSCLQEQRIEEEADQQALMLSRMLTLQDPFQGFPFTTMPGGRGVDGILLLVGDLLTMQPTQ